MATLSEEKRYIVRDDKGNEIGNYYSIIKTGGNFYLAQEKENGKYTILDADYRKKSVIKFLGYALIDKPSGNKISFNSGEIVAILGHSIFGLGSIYFLYDYEGNEIYKCDEIFATDSHYFIVKNNGKYGLIDEYCKEIIPCIYETKEAIPHDLFTEIIEIMN